MRVLSRPPQGGLRRASSRRPCSSAILAPTATFASDPPGLARFMYALGRVESGGSYTARNPPSGAYGKYQIMPSSWRGLGAAATSATPNAKPDAGQPGDRRRPQGHGAVQLARELATGRLLVADGLEPDAAAGRPFATRYVARVMALLRQTPARRSPAASRRRPTPAPTATAHSSATRRGAPMIAYSAALAVGAVLGATRVTRCGTRPTAGRDGHVHVHRARRHLVRPGRADPRHRPGSTSTASASGRSTCTDGSFARPRRRCSRKAWADGRQAHARRSRSSATAAPSVWWPSTSSSSAS